MHQINRKLWFTIVGYARVVHYRKLCNNFYCTCALLLFATNFVANNSETFLLLIVNKNNI